MGDIKLAYRLLEIEGEISKQDYIDYHEKPGQVSIAKLIAIEPLEEVMKEKEVKRFDFSDFKVTRSWQDKDKVSWEKVYSSLLEFLKIRADDSRVFDMDGLEKFEGIGYCILTLDLKDFIEKQKKRYTSHSEYAQLFWPGLEKDEHVREIIIPVRDYSVINEENARIVSTAKKFCSGLEKEIVEAFKQANQKWFEKETGYSLGKFPSKEESPIKRLREIEGNRYIVVSLIRKETPQYKEIIDILLAELQDLENGVALEGYRTKQTKKGVYVNIKNAFDRLSEERLENDDLIKVEGRYEIAP